LRLNDLKKGNKAKIINIIAGQQLKARLASLGIFINSIIEVDEVSLGKKTIKISVLDSMLALRASEANAIEVNLIDNK
jgi:Fe2+ transport system protein FeoA